MLIRKFNIHTQHNMIKQIYFVAYDYKDIAYFLC